jgi:hypothetical protein
MLVMEDGINASDDFTPIGFGVEARHGLRIVV